MTVKIVTDSTSDLTPALARQFDISVVPLTVSFGRESFLDRVEISTDEFYRRLTTEEAFPQTTQPSPNAFASVYKKLCANTKEILVLTISKKLSGTYDSALSAVQMVKGDCKIEVVNSESAAGALGLLAIWASKQAASGMSLPDLKKAVEGRIGETKPVMAFDTLKYLARGGRIGKAKGLLGVLLSVKPVLTLKDGEVSPLTQVRTMKAGMDVLYNFAASHKQIDEMAVEYATTPDIADALIDRLDSLYPKEKIYRTTVSPVLGAYTGPSVICVSVIGKT
ncbi:EDD domain protein, DegV family [Dehalogenimonas formicexedens]|uniref:EDD domain protein, DegV family n=1 Tax=Dehalogenimonas formicexedens TaxID=1839801 RepID=A0A1P8F634_9CHLR|nr:DegV family protein [Dehalogenimonas formicexedens]APV43946.1 EDD domain protein, DegV family [Dehalogenimonas formicexedens]